MNKQHQKKRITKENANGKEEDKHKQKIETHKRMSQYAFDEKLIKKK